MNKKLLNKILNDVSLDERVNNGMFNIEEDAHMDALRDYLVKKGIDEESARSFSNTILEGKYPERQAYNVNGILVTFPTPQYKADAIKRGTHFEKDPTKGQSNLFSNPAANKPAAGNTKEPPATQKTVEPKTNLPVSQASPTGVPPPPGGSEEPQSIQAKTTAAPQQTPTPTAVPTPEEEPVKEPTTLPVPDPISPTEKDANKTAIKSMLKGDDYMLERVIEWILENGSRTIVNDIQNKI